MERIVVQVEVTNPTDSVLKDGVGSFFLPSGHCESYSLATNAQSGQVPRETIRLATGSVFIDNP